MLLARIKQQILITQFRKLNVNKQIHNMLAVNYVLIPFRGKINTGDPQGLNIYLKLTRELKKETEKLNIEFSKSKDIVEHLILLKKIWLGMPCIQYNNSISKGEYLLEGITYIPYRPSHTSMRIICTGSNWTFNRIHT